MWQMALLALLALVGGTLLCFGGCAWLSPRVLDWLAAHADSRAHALRAYRVQRAESLAEQLKRRRELDQDRWFGAFYTGTGLRPTPPAPKASEGA